MIRKTKDKDTKTLIATWLRDKIKAHDFIPSEYRTKQIEFICAKPLSQQKAV